MAVIERVLLKSLRILATILEFPHILVSLTSHSIQGVINLKTQQESTPSNVCHTSDDSDNESSIRMDSITACTQGHLRNKDTDGLNTNTVFVFQDRTYGLETCDI